MGRKGYYLGLDMGTSSVGWAVTDESYKLLRAKGKDLWGIREFDEALTAVDRRTHRIARRRRQRELVRIGLLKDYFHDAIIEKDPLFYLRLENSKYYQEDKEEAVRTKNGIFCDADYEDKDYFKEYPTIYHLRKELIYNTEAHDVRLVYLALLNMFKHRGHFLNAGLSGEGSSRKMYEVYCDFCNALMEETGIVFPQNIEEERLRETLTNRDYSRSKRVEMMAEILSVDIKDKRKIAFLKAICGLKVPAKTLFEDLEIETDKKVEIDFSDYGYEERTEEIAEVLGERYYTIVELLKELYDSIVLENIMGGYTYLSEARVVEYEKHAHDLKVLKRVVKRYHSSDVYDKFFRSEEAGTYSAYVNSVNAGNKQRRSMKDRKMDNLYKSIKQLLKEMPVDDADVIYVAQELEKEKFLPKQLTSENGVIPNQAHEREMRKILYNAEKYLPFLQERDESGLTVSERIIALFTFQIPYYIGPTSDNSKTGWVVRKESGQVLPWNVTNKIDEMATSEKFISRMVRKCSYISGERVLPKASLEYESYSVLNEINNIAIDGERIPVELKQDIYNDLFKKGKKVTRKALVEYLRSRGKISDEAQISGIDIAINNSLSTYGKFKAVFGEKIDEDSCKHMVEKIVFWCTVYGDSKKFLKEQLKKEYDNVLTEEQIKRILGFKFKDWGRLSKELLELPGCDKTIGECVPLIRMMWETNLNLMELLNSPQHTYRESLAERQNIALKSLTEMQPEDLDEFYFSAPVKRMVWQTLLIIKELESVLGESPKRVFVEMARNPEDKPSRTNSRKQKFLNLYKNIKDEEADWKSIIENADVDGKLRSKKMYLYLTQKGKCMYTGKTIPLAELFDNNLYDIDHIYPRHFVKDDNIENNLVLVCKGINGRKSDNYPLEESIYNSCKDMWHELLRQKLITEEKYRRLTGRSTFTEEQKADFIARQLVETRQGTKSVAEILKKVLPQTTIVYSKATNVSDFRQSRQIVKCRSVNEFHHAHDAYLNIVVGNVYFVKFTQNPYNFIKKEYAKDEKKYRYNLSRMFDWNVVRGDEIAWVGPKENGPQGTIVTVKEMLAKNTPLMTRRNFEGHGGIANETLYSAKKASPDKYIPLKARDEKLADVTKYGGFTSVSVAYFFLVEHEVKGKKVRTLEAVPIYLRDKIEGNGEALYRYCIEDLKLINPDVRMPKIKIQSLIKLNGYFVHISGKSGERIILRNAVNLCLNRDWIMYIKKVEKLADSGRGDEEVSCEKNVELYGILMDKHQNGIYAKRPNPMGEKMKARYELFKTLTLEEQSKALMQILELKSIGVACADLTLLKEAPISGKMLMTKKISDSRELKLINQSVTGLFESQIDLLTV